MTLAMYFTRKYNKHRTIVYSSKRSSLRHFAFAFSISWSTAGTWTSMLWRQRHSWPGFCFVLVYNKRLSSSADGSTITSATNASFLFLGRMRARERNNALECGQSQKRLDSGVCNPMQLNETLAQTLPPPPHTHTESVEESTEPKYFCFYQLFRLHSIIHSAEARFQSVFRASINTNKRAVWRQLPNDESEAYERYTLQSA